MAFSLQTLGGLPDIETLEDAGLLSRKGVEEALAAAEGEEEWTVTRGAAGFHIARL
ncbi:hypothetical protein [Shinella sp. YE25]|uniref:hypothetical protein n=1 Tax=unclassified Shinella TaxID=2643062 RepID=UPI00225CB3C6|nr:hypothetical protein [Shinella sp. YE25]CAI0336565.1 hypothetical protein SHINE37_40419 [Rhizobiaceae bacterium]CAK7255099.1 protein of unknown function [Shinella sp. WSC3-e]